MPELGIDYYSVKPKTSQKSMREILKDLEQQKRNIEMRARALGWMRAGVENYWKAMEEDR